MFWALLFAAITPLSPGFAQSQSGQPADRHPDWFGMYLGAAGDELAGLTPENRNLSAAVVAHLQPWALLKKEQTNGVADDTGAICQLDGIFRTQIMAGGFLWLPSTHQILLVGSSVYSAGVRRIHIDRPHPKYPPPTWLGHSIGHWEADTLVIDTVGFNDKSWLTSGMEPHTEQLHVVERVRSLANGLLEIRSLVEDRQALTSPYTFSRYYKRVGSELNEHVCGGDPGDMRMWSAWRAKALKTGMFPAPRK